MNRGLSLYLDLVRFCAALVVVITHLAYADLSGGQLAGWRLVGNDAVMVFFVLSGLVIANVRQSKDAALRDYVASRLSRLWSVALPALVITVALDTAGRWINPGAYDRWWFAGDAPLWRFLRAATFTNELWFSSIRPFSNGPFWSLGYEFWYYAIFASLAYFSGLRGAVLAVGLSFVAGPKIMLLFPIWSMGVWAHRTIAKDRVGPVVGWVLVIGSIAAYALFRWSGLPNLFLALTRIVLGEHFVDYDLRFSNEFIASYVIGPLVAANFVGANAIRGQLETVLQPASALIRWTAQSTFALYLLHYPMLRFAGATVPYDIKSPAHVASVFFGIVFLVLAVGPLLERTKKVWRRVILQTWPARIPSGFEAPSRV